MTQLRKAVLTGCLQEGFLQAGSAVDGDGNLVFTGLSTTGSDFVGAIRNQELPK